MESHKTWLENLFESVYVVDKDRKILFWNKAAEAMTGFSADEIVGRRCYDDILQHVDFDGNHLCVNGCPLQATIKDGQRREAVVFFHHKLGHRVPVRIKVSPVRDSQGRIEGAIEIFEEYSKNIRVAELMDQYKKASMTDPLLGIGNRRYADAVFKLFRHESMEMGLSFGVVMIDLDGLKAINDAHGHYVGDEILFLFSRTVSGLLRPEDRFVRWGGDEFLIFFHGIDLEKLRMITDRLRTAINSSFIEKKEGNISITASMGAAVVEDKDALEDVVRRVDSLLYLSKLQGKNRITFFEKKERSSSSE